MTQETDTTKQDVLAGRNILLGVTGGIAAYKSCGIVTALRKRGVSARVVMTENATRFVSLESILIAERHRLHRTAWRQLQDRLLAEDD